MFPPLDLNYFNCGFLVTSPDRQVLYASEFVQKNFGWTSEDLKTDGFAKLFPPATLILFDSYLYPMLLADGACQELQIIVQSVSGNKTPALASVVNGPEDTGLHYWVLFDATQRTRLYDELITAREDLKEHALSLSRIARYDSLTGLFSRNELSERLDKAVKRSNGLGLSLAILLLDIDHFKNINDNHGHQTGDEVLREFGQIIKNSIRNSDNAARYGGEEFLILLPDAGEDDALQVGERIHATLRKKHLAGVKVTVSIGIAVKSEKNRVDVDRFLKRCDEALYRAKHAGRDRSCLAEDS